MLVPESAAQTFESWMTAHWKLLVYVAKGDEDAAQEAALSVWQHWDTLHRTESGEVDAKAYAVFTARNKAIDEQRKRFRHTKRQHPESDAELATLSAPVDGAGSHAEAYVVNRELLRCLWDQLTPREQHLVGLIAAGYTLAAIAEQWGLPLGTIKGQLSRMRRRPAVAQWATTPVSPAPLPPSSLRDARLQAGLSIRQLAARSGISHASISKVEHGTQAGSPTLLATLWAVLERACEATVSQEHIA